eukprot:TRINITY_DN19032_c0_g1_i1.p1 TRINITY_DN19032_c0_g1~~TRINITY_DN19032_c0_g1_i1.p1  ORF type:complete len:868 (-),score=171.54 TRINITY_DN19032_c0_g1_i1:24-2354(-)
MWSRGTMAFLYFTGLIYLFLGVAIISDVFMESVEVITSVEKVVTRIDPETKLPVEIHVRVWNETVSNLTLMAVGSSIAEILLSVIETILQLGKPAGKIGPGTIVGSGSYNMMLVTAICILGLQAGETKRIKHFGVFVVTTISSFWAHLWLVIVFSITSPNEIEVWEAFVTFLFFPILIAIAYAQDRSWWRAEAQADSTEKPKIVDQFMTAGSSRGTQRSGPNKLLQFIKKNTNLANKKGKMLEEAISTALTESIVGQPSWMRYRVNGVRFLSGGHRVVPTQASSSKESELAERKSAHQPKVFLGFSAKAWSVVESMKKVTVTVTRTGETNSICSVDYYTEALPPGPNSATEELDYKPVSGRLHFAAGETAKHFEIEIVDDDKFEEDEHFLVCLHNTKGAQLGEVDRATITIIDDDVPGVISFKSAQTEVVESCIHALVTVQRLDGCAGRVSVAYKTIEGTAKAGTDYESAEGVLVFEALESEKVLPITIIDGTKWEHDETFDIVLSDPTGGAKLGAQVLTTVRIKNSAETVEQIAEVCDCVEEKTEHLKMETTTWAQQFHSALACVGETDDAGNELPPSTKDMCMHFLTMPWKVLAATLPPTHMFQGKLTFFATLFYLGIITGIVGELAELFGCAIGLDDTITAISIVAIGTSLPDTFASLTAARKDKYADAAIGNVNGSNSVNVFIGLGIPWIIASLYYHAHGEKYIIPAGNLNFGVEIFLVSSVLTSCILMVNRFYFGGELGGSKPVRLIAAGIMGVLWFLYILLSGLDAYGKI